jgi:hypothetical protein
VFELPAAAAWTWIVPASSFELVRVEISHARPLGLDDDVEFGESFLVCDKAGELRERVKG